MNIGLPESLDKIIKVFSMLPGIGPKTASRLALHLLKNRETLAVQLKDALADMIDRLTYCKQCFNIAEQDLCPICSDESRDRSRVCVVEGVADLMAIEKTELYNGLYFVLHGLISPIHGIGPQEVHLDKLHELVKKNEVKEVIIATPLTTQGQTTAIYIKKVLADTGVRITRLASGIPVGGVVEYMDKVTIARALQDRKEL